ncbi:MAG: M23 family metallopeptidase [Acidimicrobiales bacterium]
MIRISLLVLLLLRALAPVPVPAAPPGADVRYRPPLDRQVSSPFEETGPYGPGNRGLDYRVLPGDVVGAIGDGVVVFAGPVAGHVWVTIAHRDGLRSSYGPLATVSVRAGAAIRAGDPVGTTGGTFHLGVRRGAVYIDPAALFSGRRHARLVPVRRRSGRA